ncbi:MAG: DUF4921 family protein [Bacillota bacterium]
MSEWRRDPVTGRWVVIAAERGLRPSDFRAAPEKVHREEACPLCPGREQETPPEVAAYRAEGTAPDTPGWRVRVVPNKFPAVTGAEPVGPEAFGSFRAWPGSGVHEMVIETPAHVRGFEDLGPDQVACVLRMWQERSLVLRRREWIKYIQVFKNVGQGAGASLAHAHSQILALPFVPPEVRAELEAAAAFRKATGACPLCAVLQEELAGGTRVVLAGRHVVALAPFAARFPFEVWVLPRDHREDFGRAGETVLREAASALREVLGRLARLLARPPYNLVLRTAPVNPVTGDCHWRLEILPRLTVPAGFEFGTGCYINPLPPESAARYLRRA